MPNNNDARPVRTYDLIGFAALDGEPVYVANGQFQFLCDGVTRNLTPKVDRNLEAIDVASGYTCNPETGSGKFYQTNMARSFTTFFNTRSLDMAQTAITIGSAYALITGMYPSFKLQVERTHTKAEHEAPGQSPMFPFTRHLAFQNNGPDRCSILYYTVQAGAHTPYIGTLSRDGKTLYVFEEADALSLVVYELEAVFRKQDVTDINIRVVRDADEVFRLENPDAPVPEFDGDDMIE